MGAVGRTRPDRRRGPAAGSSDAVRGKGLPLSLTVARYFVYVLVSMALIAAAWFGAFVVLGNSGVVYFASYAEQNAPEAVRMLEEGRLDPADLPACYRWAVFNDAGDVMASDLGNGETAEAWRTLREGASVVRYDGAAGAVRQVSAALPDGLTCVLQYDYLPDFVSKELRDALPDPQAIMTVALIASLVAAVALIAVRAARVISAKMRPLSEAAERIGRQDLDFSVGSTDVREVNEVLGGMERMRAALAESLREGWAADEARRREVAALAHDLKTPLAVARWNAELLAEGPLDAAQAESAAQVAESVDRMEGYVRLLVEASQACAAGNASGTVDAAALSAQVERQARQLCAAAGCSLAFEGASAGLLAGNGPQLVRAIMNLVSNAAEHAPAGSAVRVRLHVSGGDATDGDASDGVLRVEVADEGPGFSEAALVHGAERFFTGSPDRNAESGHFGLGLSIASDVAAAHGGTLSLANGREGGARCVIELPLAESGPE
ncbi:sensor histidine kinase [Rubneribacter sp.]